MQNNVSVISKVEKVLKRMRWKTLEFLGKLEGDNNIETYGVKSVKCPLTVAEMANFENNLMLLIVNNAFQEKLKMISMK